jgi:hypothetical protein
MAGSWTRASLHLISIKRQENEAYFLSFTFQQLLLLFAD